jgi:hypothetical protein
VARGEQRTYASGAERPYHDVNGKVWLDVV